MRHTSCFCENIHHVQQHHYVYKSDTTNFIMWHEETIVTNRMVTKIFLIDMQSSTFLWKFKIFALWVILFPLDNGICTLVDVIIVDPT
jgi:hypothetical protein